MTTRTTQSTVTFTKPFQIDSMKESQPAGDYRVDMDEELLGGLSFLAYRRIAALIHLPAISRPQTLIQIVRVTPSEFDAMIQVDGAPTTAVESS